MKIIRSEYYLDFRGKQDIVTVSILPIVKNIFNPMLRIFPLRAIVSLTPKRAKVLTPLLKSYLIIAGALSAGYVHSHGITFLTYYFHLTSISFVLSCPTGKKLRQASEKPIPARWQNRSLTDRISVGSKPHRGYFPVKNSYRGLAASVVVNLLLLPELMPLKPFHVAPYWAIGDESPRIVSFNRVSCVFHPILVKERFVRQNTIQDILWIIVCSQGPDRQKQKYTDYPFRTTPSVFQCKHPLSRFRLRPQAPCVLTWS